MYVAVHLAGAAAGKKHSHSPIACPPEETPALSPVREAENLDAFVFNWVVVCLVDFLAPGTPPDDTTGVGYVQRS